MKIVKKLEKAESESGGMVKDKKRDVTKNKQKGKKKKVSYRREAWA